MTLLVFNVVPSIRHKVKGDRMAVWIGRNAAEQPIGILGPNAGRRVDHQVQCTAAFIVI